MSITFLDEEQTENAGITFLDEKPAASAGITFIDETPPAPFTNLTTIAASGQDVPDTILGDWNRDGQIGPIEGAAAIGRQIGYGFKSDMPRMFGDAMKYVSEPGKYFYDTGKGITDWVDQQEKDNPDLLYKYDWDKNPVMYVMGSGGRQVMQSIVPPMLTAAAIAGIVATLPVSATAAATIGTIAGVGGMLVGSIPAGLSQGQQTYEKLIAEGVDDETAKVASRWSALIEWGGESITNMGGIGKGFFKLAGIGLKGGKILGKDAIKYLAKLAEPKTWGTMAGHAIADFARTIGTEVGTEVGQAVGQAAVENVALGGVGAETMSLIDAAKEVIGPTIGMTILMAPLGIHASTMDVRRQNAMKKAMLDPGTPQQYRAAAMLAIAKDIYTTGDTQAADNFAINATTAINFEQPMPLSDVAVVDPVEFQAMAYIEFQRKSKKVATTMERIVKTMPKAEEAAKAPKEAKVEPAPAAEPVVEQPQSPQERIEAALDIKTPEGTGSVIRGQYYTPKLPLARVNEIKKQAEALGWTWDQDQASPDGTGSVRIKPSKDMLVVAEIPKPEQAPAVVPEEPIAAIPTLKLPPNVPAAMYQAAPLTAMRQQQGKSLAIHPIDQHIFETLIRPLLATTAHTFATYQREFPNHTHVALEKEGNQDWALAGVGTLAELARRPKAHPKAYKQVTDFESTKTIAHSLTKLPSYLIPEEPGVRFEGAQSELLQKITGKTAKGTPAVFTDQGGTYLAYPKIERAGDKGKVTIGRLLTPAPDKGTTERLFGWDTDKWVRLPSVKDRKSNPAEITAVANVFATAHPNAVTKVAAEKKQAELEKTDVFLKEGKEGNGLPSKVADPNKAIPHTKITAADRRTTWHRLRNAWVTALPLFQGNKRDMSEPVIKSAINPETGWSIDQANRITTIYEPFGGGGSWGLFNATTMFRNARRIILGEQNAKRLQMIEYMHTKGDKFSTDLQTPDENGRSAMDIFKIEWDKGPQISSGGGLVGRLKTVIQNKMEDKQPINDDQLKLLQIVNDLMPRSATPMLDGIAKVVNEVHQLYDMAQDFARAGGIIEYRPGDAYDPNNALEQGDHVLALLDPPYFLTTGYGEKMVGIDTYEKTLDLIDRVVGAGNNVIYTDSAWWLPDKGPKAKKGMSVAEKEYQKAEWRSEQAKKKQITPADKTKALTILKAIQDRLNHFQAVDQVIGGHRYEVLGLHNPMPKTVTEQQPVTEANKPMSKEEWHAKAQEIVKAQRFQVGDGVTYKRKNTKNAANHHGQITNIDVTPDLQEVKVWIHDTSDDTKTIDIAVPPEQIIHIDRDALAKRGKTKLAPIAGWKPAAKPEVQMSKRIESKGQQDLSLTPATPTKEQVPEGAGLRPTGQPDAGAGSSLAEKLINKYTSKENNFLDKKNDLAKTIAYKFDIPNTNNEETYYIARAALIKAANAYDPNDPKVGSVTSYLSKAIYRTLVNFQSKQYANDRATAKETSLQQPVGQRVVDDASLDRTLEDVIPDWHELSAEQQASQRDIYRTMQDAIAKLDPTSRMIVDSINTEQTQIEVAKELGISQPAITDRKKVIFKNLRAVLEAKGIDNDMINLVHEKPAPEVGFSKSNVIAPIWYSKLGRVIEAITMPSMTVGQLKGIIAKGGVKADELFWTGMDDFIKAHQDNDKVTKDEVRAAVQEVKIEEVMKGRHKPRYVILSSAGLNVSGGSFDTVQDARKWIDVYPGDKKGFHVEQRSEQATETDAKFATYQTPGGENYRELLVTLPSYRPKLADFKSRAEYDAAVRAADERGTKDFASTHFPEAPNILVHIRFNERTVDGKKVLFIEEVQSDWGQKGREMGFIGELPAGFETYQSTTGRWKVRSPDGIDVGYGDTEAEAIADYGVKNRQVPQMPFSDTSKGWARLAMKRMLRYAAENGYDRVAWTTGEMQADRYDLAKQLSSEGIKWQTEGDGKIRIYAESANDMRQVINETYPLEKLSGVIGKDATRQIDEAVKNGSTIGQITGEDLKVGGEGMKTFYDRILPNIANNLGKRFGAKVGEMKIEKRSQHDRTFNIVDKNNSVPSIDITPAMKESVLTEGQPLFSKAPLTNHGVTAAQANSKVVNWIKKQANLPKIAVIQTVEDAAQMGLSADSMSRLRNAQPRGFFFKRGNQVVVIADALRTSEEALEVVLHETIGHFGVSKVLGKDFDAAMLKLSKEISDDALQQTAMDYAKDLPDQGLDNVLDSDANRRYLAAEYIAKNAQTEPTLWQKLVEIYRKAMTKFGPTSWANKHAKDRTNIENLIQASRDFVARGRVGGMEAYLQKTEGIRMAKLGIAPEQDAAHLAAVEKGDTATAQKMVDEAAKEAGYTIEGWHGTDTEFTVFDKSQIGTAHDLGWLGKGFYFTNKKNEAKLYSSGKTPLIRGYINLKNPFRVTIENGKFATETLQALKQIGVDTRLAVNQNDIFVFRDPEQATRTLQKHGFDGVMAKHGDYIEYVLFDPNQIKSAKPVTRDDAGNVISLSERFNQATPDIRMSKVVNLANPFAVDGAMRDDYYRFMQDWKPGFQSYDVAHANAIEAFNKKVTATQGGVKELLIKADADGFLGGPTGAIYAEILMNSPEFAAMYNDPNQRNSVISIQTWRLAQGTEAARALAYRRDRLKTPEQRQQAILELLASPPSKVYKNWTNNMSAEQRAVALAEHRTHMNRAIAALKKLGIDVTAVKPEILNDPQKFSEIINEITRQYATTGDKIYEYWRNSILSGLHTNIVNIISNATMATWELFIQKPIEALLNVVVKDPNAPTFESLGRAYRMMWPQIHAANLAMVKSFTTETGMFTAIDSAGKTAIGGWQGKLVRVPQRALLAMDEWYKTILTNAMAYDYATRIADKNNMVGQDRENFIEQAANDDSGNSAAYEAAHKEAVRLLFQEKTGPIGTAILSARNAKGLTGGVMKFLFPFITTPTNLIKIGIKKSPFGIIAMGMNGIAALRGTPETRYIGPNARAMIIRDTVEQMIAWTMTGLLYALTAPGGDDDDKWPIITGSISGSPSEKRFQQLNIPPQSFRIGDRWYSYARLEPFSTSLTMIVDALNSFRKVKSGQGLNRYDAAKILSLVRDKTYLQGLGDLMRGIEDPQQWVQMGRNFSSSWMPNIFKQAMRAADPLRHDIRVREKGMAWLGQTLVVRGAQGMIPIPGIQPIPKYDHWGRTISKDVDMQLIGQPFSDIAWRIISPMKIQKVRDETNIDRMIWNWNRAHEGDDKQWWPGNVRPSITFRRQEYPMTDEQYERYQVRRGQLAMKMAQRINWNFDNPTAHHMRVIEAVFTRAGKKVRDSMKREVIMPQLQKKRSDERLRPINRG